MTRYLLFSALIWLTGVSLFANEYNVGSHRAFENIEVENSVQEISYDFYESSDASTEAELSMDAIKEDILKQKRFVNRLDSATFISLPVGLTYSTDTLADPDYFIIIDKATIYPQYAEFSAFMSVKNPIDGKVVRFRANNIKFSFKSGLINGFKLELVSQLRTKLSDSSYLYWMPGSFVDWDCNGFKSIGVNASVELNQKKFVKVDTQSGKELGKVTSNFFISVSSLSDIILELSFDPFKIKGFDEAYFSFTKLTLDCSDSQNTPNFSLPSNYPGGYTGEKAVLWRGFYVQEAEVFLGEKFKTQQGTAPSFYAKDLILDDFGLTGEMGVDNLLDYSQGKLGTWNMSISHFEFAFFTGNFQKLELEGGVEIGGIDQPMMYEALYDVEGNYHFGINPGKEVGFNVFSAKVNLDATSRIDVWVQDGMFLPAATLHGDISFDCKNGANNSVFNVPNVEFTGMRIATKAPVFDLDYIALVSEEGRSLMNNFPITVDSVHFDKRNKKRASFGFKLNVNLVGGDELGFKGDTYLEVVASVDEQKWEYKGVELKEITIDVNLKSGFHLKGQIALKEGDATYGNGFRGRVDATFASTFEMQAVVVFGKVNGFRYFFADAFFTKDPGAAMGPFWVNGFGGGVYFKMRQAISDDEGSKFGESLSGINYVPDKKVFLGLKVGVKGSFASPGIIDAKLNFGISFTNSFGVQQITFDGEATMLKPPAGISDAAMKAMSKLAARGEKPEPEPSAMRVRVAMLMDFQNNVFHSEMEMFLNVGGILKGNGENNRAGWGIFHRDSDKWYLHIGTPNDPVGVSFVNLMEVNSYFMAGHEIPDAMLMNKRVLEILDMDQSDFNGERKDGELTTGKGLAFGANFKFDTGDLTFLIFYARFELGGGFDIMLLDYGSNAFCKGRSGAPGINGWYAKGQAYAYFAGKIGIKVKVFGRKKTFDIINLQAAAAIRMEGPNPTWMMGVVGGKYRILGGMIKGSCKFKMTVGEKCEIRTMKDLSDLEIIADLTPAKDAEEVDLYTMPQAVFNMPVDKVLRIAEDPELTKTFKINLEEFKVYSEDGSVYEGEPQWNEDKTSIAYKKEEIFLSNSVYKVVTKISFDEKVDGEWKPYKDEDGKVHYETKEASFKTGPMPKEMRESNIVYTYPVDKMLNFYKDEYNKAYVSFNEGLGAFFKNTKGYTQKARWTQAYGESMYTSLKYIKEAKMVEIEVPQGLVNEKIYRLDLVHVPTDENNMDSNISESTKAVINNGDDDKMEITTRKAKGVIGNDEEIAFYGLDFRCSKYNKFLDKIPQSELTINYLHSVAPGIDLLKATVMGTEMLDKFELGVSGGLEPMVRCEAILDGSDWYQANVGRMIYNEYPIHQKAQITWRQTNIIGIPPTRNIQFWQIDSERELTSSDIDKGSASIDADRIHFMYALTQTWAADYSDVRNKLSVLVNNNKIAYNSKVSEILNTSPWPQASKGNYPIRISYYLPGINKVTSSKKINMRNNFIINQVNLMKNE